MTRSKTKIAKQINENEVNLTLRKNLEIHFTDSFVIENLQYYNQTIDFAIIVKDRIIEVVHITELSQYILEFEKIAQGKYSFNKHDAFKNGKWISSAIYFMAPARLLPADNIPEQYGLITYNKLDLSIEIKIEADYIKDKEFLTRDNYKTIAQKINRKLYENKATQVRVRGQYGKGNIKRSKNR